MPHLLDKKNVDMLTSHKVFTVDELRSRCEIMLENYCKTVSIEANTMVDMANTLIAPAVASFAAKVAKDALRKKEFDPSAPCEYEKKLVKKLAILTDGISEKTAELQSALIAVHGIDGIIPESEAIRDAVLPKMQELRVACDEAETVTAKSFWPFPTYADILFSVR